MTQITEDHVEWAVVNRLRRLFEETPHQNFSVTQTYSLFTATICWVMQRIRIQTGQFRPEDSPQGENDRKAHSLLKRLQETAASEEPWSLPIAPVERIVSLGQDRIVVPPSMNFEGRSIGKALVNLRNAAAHGDARNVVPFNAGNLLVGFSFTCEDFDRHGGKKVWDGTITLLESDLRRIGIRLSDLYCSTLRHSEEHRHDSHFGTDAASIKEVAA